MKLVKAKGAYWGGNGVGNQTAEWTVEGREDIRIFKSGYDWVAYQNEKRIVRWCDSRKEVVERLTELL